MKLLQSMHALRSKHHLHLYGNMNCQVFKGGIQNYIAFWPKINTIKGNYCTWDSAEWSKIGHEKTKCFKKLSRNVNYKSLANFLSPLGNLSTHITIFTVIVTISGRIMRDGCRIIIKDYHAPFGAIQWCA